jgi:hypothetical protein
MKIVLAVLLCFVLTISECFALKGGPVFGNGGANIIGRYAGVLRPPFCPLADPSQCPTGFNSLGLFTLSIPQTGLGTGAAFIFTNGRSFTGTINAIGDPNTAVLSGVLSTEYQITPLGSSGTPRTCATAGGRVSGKIAAKSGITSVSSILIKGTAVVSVSCVTIELSCPACTDGTTSYQIDGFKQSNSTQ